MDTLLRGAQETDLHRLELRFAETRLSDPRAVERLARSIERCGQLIPCIAVLEAGSAQWVLLDGYRRIAARCAAWVATPRASSLGRWIWPKRW